MRGQADVPGTRVKPRLARPHQLLQHSCQALQTRADALQALASAVPNIYKALSALSAHDMDIATSVLLDTACIWVGTGFVSCKQVAFG